MAPYEDQFSNFGAIKTAHFYNYVYRLQSEYETQKNPAFSHDVKNAIASVKPVIVRNIFLAYYFNQAERLAILERHQFPFNTLLAAILIAKAQIRLYLSEKYPQSLNKKKL